MGRYGVQVSQQGIPLDRAADYQKVLDSNWKFIDVLMEIDIDVSYVNPAYGTGVVEVTTHGLGYVPGFEFFPGSGATVPDPYSASIMSYIRADSQKVYLSVLPQGSYRLVGKLRVFTLNILEEYSAPSYGATSSNAQVVGRYGAKFLDLEKNVGDIEDESMIPFTLNTRGKQVSVHKHGTAVADAVTGTLTVRHEVGYPPTYLLCRVERQDEWKLPQPWPYKTKEVSGPLVSEFYSAKANIYDIEFKGVQSVISGRFGYVILKDPAEIAG